MCTDTDADTYHYYYYYYNTGAKLLYLITVYQGLGAELTLTYTD